MVSPSLNARAHSKRRFLPSGDDAAVSRKHLMDSRLASSMNSRNAMRVVGVGGNASSGGASLGTREGVVAVFFALPWFFLLLGLMMCWQRCWACITGCGG